MFVATFFLHSLRDDDDLAWLTHFASYKLTTDEAKALVHVREAGQVTNADYRDLNGVDTLEASAHLRRLRDLGLLKQHDRGAATYYTPTGRLLSPEPLPTQQRAETTADTRPTPRMGSLDPTNTISDRPDHAEKRGNPVPETLPADLADAVARLNDWTPQPELRRLIQRLCDLRPLTAEELSSILNRSRTYLRTEYIGPMVRAKGLSYTNPDKPKDPRQKYRRGPANA